MGSLRSSSSRDFLPNLASSRKQPQALSRKQRPPQTAANRRRCEEHVTFGLRSPKVTLAWQPDHAERLVLGGR